MSVGWLEIRQQQRESLLQHLTATLAADNRFVAAWLVGSLGRETEDELSDLDVWVVVEDEYMPTIASERRNFVAQIAEPLLIQEMPGNAPAGGVYLLVLYPGKAGPQQVDWYWQPRALAQIPPRARLLFDRVNLSAAAQFVLSSDQAIARASELIVIAWAMSFIVVKKIVRGETWTAVKMISTLQLEIDEMHALLADRWDGPLHSDRRTGSLPVDPAAQLAFLRRLTQELQALTSEIDRRDGEVPVTAAREVQQFIEMVQGTIDDWNPAPKT